MKKPGMGRAFGKQSLLAQCITTGICASVA